MIDLLGASFLAIGFAVIVQALGLMRHATSALTLSSDAMKVMADAALSDDQKERAMQAHTFKLFRVFLILTLGSLVALLVPLAVIWGLARFGLISFDGVMHAALSWPFLVGVSLVAVILFVVLSRTRRGLRE
jgi:hypothetical protein